MNEIMFYLIIYFLGNCLKEKDVEEFRGIFEVFDSV